MSGRPTCERRAESSFRVAIGTIIIVCFVILPVVLNFQVTDKPGSYFPGFASMNTWDKVFSVGNSLISGLTATGLTSKCMCSLYFAYALISLGMSGIFRLQDLLFAAYGVYFTLFAEFIIDTNSTAVLREREWQVEDLEGGFGRPTAQTLPIAFLLIMDVAFVAHSKLVATEPLIAENAVFSHFCKMTEADQLMVVYNIALSAVCFMVIPKRPYWFRISAVLVATTLSLVYVILSFKLFDDGARSADLASSCAFLLSFFEDLAEGAADICKWLQRRFRRAVADEEDPKSDKSD